MTWKKSHKGKCKPREDMRLPALLPVRKYRSRRNECHILILIPCNLIYSLEGHCFKMVDYMKSICLPFLRSCCSFIFLLYLFILFTYDFLVIHSFAPSFTPLPQHQEHNNRCDNIRANNLMKHRNHELKSNGK